MIEKQVGVLKGVLADNVVVVEEKRRKATANWQLSIGAMLPKRGHIGGSLFRCIPASGVNKRGTFIS